MYIQAKVDISLSVCDKKYIDNSFRFRRSRSLRANIGYNLEV